MADWVLSVMMLAGAGLLIGGVYLLFTRKNRKQGILMLVASMVMFLNVAIWTVPAPAPDATTNSSNNEITGAEG
ncbi:hypothetical protein [Parasphingorhabdus sp.]|uniref:hypothetical protein n=1 Tax=Parasphingorhabdus sp. TaxID=2709688 RepID=UPI002F95173B